MRSFKRCQTSISDGSSGCGCSNGCLMGDGADVALRLAAGCMHSAPVVNCIGMLALDTLVYKPSAVELFETASN